MNYKDQRGIIPLFFLIPIVLVATGVIGVQSGFFQNVASGFKKFLAAPSPSNLPQSLGQWQQEPTRKPSPTPTLPKGVTIQSGPYNYKPDAAAAKAGVPSFTISAPSGWAKYPVSGTMLARFESQEADTETVKGGEVTSNAVIIVRATDGYDSLDSFVNDYKASGKKVSGYQQQSSSSQHVGGNPGYRLEFSYKSKVGESEIIIRELDYLTFKDGISFLIKGYSANSAWGEHAGEIQSAFGSFKFN